MKTNVENVANSNRQMGQAHQKKGIAYQVDAMVKTACLICGERLGSYKHYGKDVCAECVDHIRVNF